VWNSLKVNPARQRRGLVVKWETRRIKGQSEGPGARTERPNAPKRQEELEFPGNGVIGFGLICTEVTEADHAGKMTPQAGMLVANLLQH
jgi:hypothetical protein